jgi:hypothetical protein
LPFLDITHRCRILRKWQSIGRAPYGEASTVEHMVIDHRGSDVVVPQEFLHGANVVAVLEQMGGEGVPKGMAGRTLVNPGLPNGVFDRPLDRALVDVMAV